MMAKPGFTYNSSNTGHINRLWYDVDRYMSEATYKENRNLTVLRPSLQNLLWKEDLVGAEIGVFNGLNSNNILHNLSMKHFYMIDLNVPARSPGIDLIKKDNVTFMHGSSTNMIPQLPNDLDFIYIDGDHDHGQALLDMQLALKKVKVGGIIGGHDYDQLGVVTSVNTFMHNIQRYIKKKPDWHYAACQDDHPGYPKEYKEFGFPLDWWYVKDAGLDDLKVHPLRLI